MQVNEVQNTGLKIIYKNFLFPAFCLLPPASRPVAFVPHSGEMCCIYSTKLILFLHKVFLSVGHDEYWSAKMRQNVETARDYGVSLGFFASNTCYWQIRFEPSLITKEMSRTIVAYKDCTNTLSNQYCPNTFDYGYINF